MFLSPITILPLYDSSSPAIILRMVLLPLPLSPIIASTSPFDKPILKSIIISFLLLLYLKYIFFISINIKHPPYQQLYII